MRAQINEIATALAALTDEPYPLALAATENEIDSSASRLFQMLGLRRDA